MRKAAGKSWKTRGTLKKIAAGENWGQSATLTNHRDLVLVIKAT
jgi:hypothetical protein